MEQHITEPNTNPGTKVPRQKSIVFLLGLSGSGKTIIAKKLSGEIPWSVLDTDFEILRDSHEKRISDIFEKHGEPHFRELERKAINALRQTSSNLIVATGGGLPAIPNMMIDLNQIGTTIYLKAGLETLWKRLCLDPKQLEDRPLLKAKGKEALLQQMSERESIYHQSTITLNTDRLSVNEVCDLIKNYLQAR